MYRFVIVFCFCFSAFLAYAQKEYRIQGKLVDSLSSEPLSFATLRLESSTKPANYKGLIADEKGVFEWNGILEDSYILRVEYVGFTTKYLTIKHNNANAILDLGTIRLSAQTQLLETVTVTGIKPNVVATLEKQVFKAEQFDVAKGGTATDVLKNIPSIMVNAEGELSMRGSKGFLILINGKPTQVDAATILSQITANTIERVELITAPSAKYDADGKAGIINIVTKKGSNDGWSLSGNLQYGLPRLKQYLNASEPYRYGIDFSTNYRMGKWDISTSLNYLKNDIAGRRVGDVNTTINNIYTSFPSEGERSFKRDNYGLRTSIIYSPSTQDDWVLGVYLGEREQYRTADITYNNVKTDLLTNSVIGRANYYNANLVLKSGSFRVYNLDYTHRFQDKSSISVSGLYEYAMIDGYTKNRNLNIKNYADTLQYTLNTGRNPLDAYR